MKEAIENNNIELLVEMYDKGWRIHHEFYADGNLKLWLTYILENRSGILLSSILTLDEKSLLHEEYYKTFLSTPAYVKNLIKIYKGQYAIFLKSNEILNFIIEKQSKTNDSSSKKDYSELLSIFILTKE